MVAADSEATGNRLTTDRHAQNDKRQDDATEKNGIGVWLLLVKTFADSSNNTTSIARVRYSSSGRGRK
jgi:hypothetical protein